MWTLELASRDALDTALVVVALVLVYSHSVSTTDPTSIVGAVVAALVSLDLLVYLVVVGVGGICFLAYDLFYLPGRTEPCSRVLTAGATVFAVRPSPVRGGR